ncbi:MAG: Gfo/Idh/MocA family oxidoreductase [Armatimonadetes bacterium]|nr:Gfo/Idh/MocA family oxidoreductase [Armatimonadota bacterium]
MDKLRIGVIGVSGRGRLARQWHQPQAGGRSLLVGGADINPAFRQQFAEEVEGAQVTDDYRRLLERDDLDAVAVTSPDFMHEEHAVAALSAGKHVFCEKPLAITIEGCDRILEAWRASGKHLMVGFNMRYMNLFRVMKEIIDSGAIGDIKAVWVRHFVGHGGHFYYHDWHATQRNATSLLLQKGSHDIDMIHWLAGAYTTRVTAFGTLSYYGGEMPNDLECPTCDERRTCPDFQRPWPGHEKCAFRQEVDVEDNNMVLMQLEGGIMASYLQCHFTPDYHRNYTFIGTEGRLENSEPDMKVIVKTRKSGSYRELANRVYEVKPAEGSHAGADPVIAEDFLDMVLNGKQPVATPLAGRNSVAVGCTAAESLRQNGIPLDIRPAPAWALAQAEQCEQVPF